MGDQEQCRDPAATRRTADDGDMCFADSPAELPRAAGLGRRGGSSGDLSRQSSLTDYDGPSAEDDDYDDFEKEDGRCPVADSKTVSSKEQTSPSECGTNKNVPKKRKKKKYKKRITICMSHCRYAVVRRMALKFGMCEVSEDEPWDVFWTDTTMAMERMKDMKRFQCFGFFSGLQKINHFPGMSEITRKDLLARNLNRMLKISPKEYNFFPKTWCLPAECHDLLAHSRGHRSCTYICKPDTGCQGRGIFLAKSIKDVKLAERTICQLYVSRPFLIDGYKFDLRIYTLITSCDPLRVYVYNEGLARFATSRYQEPTPVNVSNVYMHLTNYSVNKHSRTYVVDDEAGSKRKISSINNWLESKGYNVPELWARIDEVIMKTVIAAQPIIKHSYHTYFAAHDYTCACFELLGFDILLDHKLKPYLLEVNHSPSYHTETAIDVEVKEDLISDTFRLLNLQKTNKHKVMEDERRRTQERLQGFPHKESSHSSRGSIADTSVSREMGNYRCVYPPRDGPDKYLKFFQQNASSVYQETAASRARDECTRQLREELETKARLEATRRAGPKHREVERLRSESPGCQENCRQRASHNYVKKHLVRKQSPQTGRDRAVGLFSPEPIWEDEEQERLAALHHREMLVHSQGVFSVVQEVVHRSEKYKREQEMLCRHSIKRVVPFKLPVLQQVPALAQAAAAMDRKYGDMSSLVICPALKASETSATAEDHPQQHSVLQNKTGLAVQCNNAPLSARPSLTQAPWWTGKQDFRSTRAHNARVHTNNVKLQELYKRQANHHIR